MPAAGLSGLSKNIGSLCSIMMFCNVILANAAILRFSGNDSEPV